MFSFAKLIFEVELSSPLDRFVLFGLREYFEAAFLHVCKQQGDLSVYESLFGQALSPDPAAVKRFQKPPLPFAFDLPLLSSENESSVIADMGLSLAGSVVNHFECFISAINLALKRLADARRIGAVVRGISSIAADGGRLNISNDGRGMALLSGNDLWSPVDDSSTLLMTFLTPLHLVHDKKPVRSLTFSGFIRPLMRRVSSLAYYYGGNELDLDFKWLSAESQKVSAGADNPRWEKWPNGASGLTGEVSFNGKLQEYIPFILVGEFFHLGKGSAYGMGNYRLSSDR